MSADIHGESQPEFFDRIQQTRLPERVAELVDEYDRVCGERDRFLWRWIYSLFPSFTLSSVDPDHAEHVRNQKMILTMYVTVLDDLIESEGDRETFEEARFLARPATTVDPDRAAVDDDYFGFIERLWTEFTDGLEDAPRAEEFDDVFYYDIQQTLNAMEYSAVVSDNPRIANLRSAERYDAHNMVMFPYADVDLMYSPTFDLEDYGTLRDLLWDLQEMARIGNWLTTWEREIYEEDYSAGIVVLALEEGIVTPDELQGTEAQKDAAIARIKDRDVEQVFRDRWADRYCAVRDRDSDAKSVDLDALVDGMETVFEYHLESRGFK